ncbi:hypothetical protein J5X84_40960 [Streptosporangiaceae bacterium NEAU-GS5]|nr:hypothetical protein [Streptosporangiaceae bacterium NEAU-GS5]
MATTIAVNANSTRRTDSRTDGRPGCEAGCEPGYRPVCGAHRGPGCSPDRWAVDSSDTGAEKATCGSPVKEAVAEAITEALRRDGDRDAVPGSVGRTCATAQTLTPAALRHRTDGPVPLTSTAGSRQERQNG